MVLLAGVVVAIAVPVGLITSGGGMPAQASQAQPVVDRDYIYGQLFDMAYNDVYRVSGADGAADGPELDPCNLPLDGQRLAGALPALEAAAHRQEGDDAPSRSSRPSRITTSAAARAADQPELLRFDPNYRWDSTTPR